MPYRDITSIFRSREVSGQQTSNLFSGSFMSSQSSQMECNQDQHGYDMDGPAHLMAVLQVFIHSSSLIKEHWV